MSLRCCVCDQEMEDEIISIETEVGDCEFTIKLCEECDEMAFDSNDLDRIEKLAGRLEKADVYVKIETLN